MTVGFIINEIKDEFTRLEDWDFELTIHFPSQFDINHFKSAVQSAQKKIGEVKTEILVSPDLEMGREGSLGRDIIHW
eukprot:12901343-Prorocentrum_lima.AAC.1